MVDGDTYKTGDQKKGKAICLLIFASVCLRYQLCLKWILQYSRCFSLQQYSCSECSNNIVKMSSKVSSLLATVSVLDLFYKAFCLKKVMFLRTDLQPTILFQFCSTFVSTSTTTQIKIFFCDL